ncbi:P-loop containing nucleoside triphosphate hydrolase protein [Xylogone sp. PMI_703]|nr:P-loop containing nucleoside triphosphate hydrolase protein [Xylogone sp. PMI_703]
MMVQSLLVWFSITRPRLRLRSHTAKVLFRASSRFSIHSNHFPRRHRRKSSFPPSPEQKKIAALCSEQNVVVSARPGSGKTATAEAIVADYPDKRVAVLTYSKRLQVETELRLRAYSNCTVFTFHAMAGLLFEKSTWNDAILLEQIRKALHRNELPQWVYDPFDIIVLDEFQDCTELIFWLTICFTLANDRKRADGQPAKLVVLGDERQSIYQFRGADQRYLTLASELLGSINCYGFANVPLNQSFRLSEQTAQFINQVFLGGEVCITSSKSGPKPIVLRCSPYQSYSLAKKLFPLIKQYGARNTAILAPSIRQRRPLQGLTNILCEKFHVPTAVPIDDESPLDDKVIKGKMCLSTIHQFKGSERDLIILVGFDSSFFKYFGRGLPDDRCPNEVYVALTRARKQPVLVHDEQQRLMPFVSVEALHKTAEIINMTKEQLDIATPHPPGRPPKLGFSLPTSTGVRDMTRHIQDESLDGIVKDYLCTRQLSPPLPEEEHINMKSVVRTDSKRGFHEAVADINGLVVGAAFEHCIAGTLNTLGLSQMTADTLPLNSPSQRISQLCRYACGYEAQLSGYHVRLIQMKNHDFDWIKPEDIALAQDRLQAEVRYPAVNLRFEVNVEQDFNVGEKKIRLRGRTDIIAVSSPSNYNNDERIECIWEVKLVRQLSKEHIVQACICAYLLTPESGALPRIVLYNVRDGEKWEIIPHKGREGLRGMIESILRLKYTIREEMEYEEFIDMCTKAKQSITNLG